MSNVIHGNRHVQLNICDCGRLHFTYGPITLHFDRGEFQAFAEVVSRLAAQVPDVESHPDPLTMAPTRTNTLCH